MSETDERPAGIYLHIPFCRTKCHYCDFNTYAGIDDLIPTYVAALAGEIARGASETERAGRRLVSIFFGGGTPSLLSGAQVAQLLTAVADHWGLPGEVEITLEANPGTVSLTHLRALRAAGINRLSFGVQTFQPRGLQVLGRTHRVDEVLDGVAAARRAGLDNLSIDLIYGWPGQTLAEWRADLRQAIDLGLPHLSLYPLTVESGTPLAGMVKAGQVRIADDDLLAEQYELATEQLAAAGYAHYEIANWAVASPGQPLAGAGSVPVLASQHNLLYWRNREYWGGGPGAHSHWSGRRWMNQRNPRRYIQQVVAGQSLVVQAEQIEPRLAMAETMMLGLRLSEGVAASAFAARYGQPLTTVFAEPLGRHLAAGQLTWSGEHLVVPAAHRFQLDGIVVDFLPEQTISDIVLH